MIEALAIILGATVPLLVVALLVLLSKYVTAKEGETNATRERDRLTLQIPGLTATIAERDGEIVRLEADNAATKAALVVANARAVHGMSVGELVDAVNGLPADPDGLRPDRDASTGAAAVPERAVPGATGAHGDQLL